MSDGKPIDNYRVFYLQEAIRLEKLPSLRELVQADADAWQGKKAPLTIAMSRYLAMFLLDTSPEKKWLHECYHACRRATATGGGVPPPQILEQVTGMNMAALDQRFRRFVLERGPVDGKWNRMRDKVREYVMGL